MAIDELLARAAGNLAVGDTIQQSRQPIVDNRGRRGADRMNADQIDRFARTGSKDPAPPPAQDLFASAIAQLQGQQGGPGVGQADPNAVSADQNELMKMALAALMDPEIDANDVGSQLLQQIAMDTLGPNQTTADSPGGLKKMFGGILQNLFTANAQAQAPKAGRR